MGTAPTASVRPAVPSSLASFPATALPTRPTSTIYAGKVLSNRGSGSDAGILAGIEWAIANDCAVVSMSLGASTTPGQSFSRVFENVARRALAAGTLIIATAGNDSSRPGSILASRQPVTALRSTL